MTLIEHLQQNVEHVRVRLFDFVQQDHRVRLAAHGLRERAGVFVTDVPRRRTDEPRHGELLHVFAHVDADQGRRIGEQELGQRPRQLGLADARGPREDERPDRTTRILEARAATADRAGERLDGLILTDHRQVQLVLHPEQARRFGLLQTRDGNTRPAAHDEGDLFLAKRGAMRLTPLLPVFLLATDLRLQITLVIPQRGRLLEILIADRRFLLVVDRFQLFLELGHLGRRHLRRQTGARAGLVNHVDRLIRQEAVGDVALRQLGRGKQRLVGDVHTVVVFVLLAKPLQNLHGLIDRGRLDHDRLESTFEGSVLLDVLAILVERGGTDTLQFAARERRLEHVTGVDRAFGGSGTDERVQFVDEQDHLLVLRDLVHDRLQSLFELTTILRASDHGRHVEREHAIVTERIRAVAVRDELRESFHDRGLAHTGLSDQHRIVLLPARQHFHDPLNFLRASDRGIELSFRRKLRQVAAEMIECRRFRLLVSLRRRSRRRYASRLFSLRRLATLRHFRAKKAQRFRPRRFEVDARVGQHLCGDPLLFAKEAQQQMFGADVAVIEIAGFRHRELKHLFGARSIRQIRSGRLCRFPLLDGVLDLLGNVVEIHVEVLQHRRRNALTLADQAEQDMLGAHILVMQTCRFLACHRENLPHPLGEVVAVHRPLRVVGKRIIRRRRLRSPIPAARIWRAPDWSRFPSTRAARDERGALTGQKSGAC